MSPRAPRPSARRTTHLLLLVLAALALSCSDSGDKPESGFFESDLPRGSSGDDGANAGAADAASESGSAGPKSSNPTAARDSSDANRTIVEADVIQLDGDRLYALSRVAGLAIIDVSDPTALKVLGRYRELPGTPFEMYLRGEVAILMFTGWTQYERDEKGAYSSVTTSKILALDVADPNAIAPLGAFDVPGIISDSRIVGDVLYVIGYEDGYCWRCDKQKPATSVSSLKVGDPRAIEKVDELRYADQSGQWSWQRSVTVTNQRMYVAGPEYGQNGPIGSTIQVVDISDAGGALVQGATLQARGEIRSRWQMDETDGVLRVLSQSPQWQTTTPPALQTFEVVSSQKFTPLATLDIHIPDRETLRSARFDGPRGYLITAIRQDPLFTLDLSDPAHPKQVGELELPGFVYHMEPRGDRLIGLGFDQGNPAGSVTVSLFDVTHLASPKLLSRVNFGGDWGRLPEDQDRIHKVFRILDDEGLILVPFMGYQRNADVEYCRGQNVGGVQLIDYANDTLKSRGTARSETEVRRALIHADHLISVSDQRVEAFSLADRDALSLHGTAILANTVRYAARLGDDVVARVVTPDWGDRYTVEFTTVADSGDVNEKLSELSLDDAFESEPGQCNTWWNLESYHTQGSRLYTVFSGYRSSGKGEPGQREMGVIVIDGSDPKHPTIAGRKSWIESDRNGWSSYYGDYAFGDFSNEGPYLWHGNALAYIEERGESISSNVYRRDLRLRVIDLRDPEKLSIATLALETDQQYSRLIADGDRILTSHYAAPNGMPAPRGRYFVDSFDISNPRTPKAIGSVNVPGSLVHYDRASGRAITAQTHRVIVRGSTYMQCYERFAMAQFDFDNTRRTNLADSPGTCTGLTQSLHLVALGSDVATLEDTFAVEEKQRIASWGAGKGRVFATLGTGYGGYYGAGADVAIADCFGDCEGVSVSRPPVQLLVLGGFASGQFAIGRLKVEPNDTSASRGFWGSSRLYAAGSKALLFGNDEVAIVDASDVEKPEVSRTVELVGYPYSVEVLDGTALVAMGEQGVQWFDL